MTALTCIRGWVASGKSTRAREIAKATGAVVVNRDVLRLQLLGTYWTGNPEDEYRVTVAEEAQVLALMKADIPVIVDSCHLTASYLRKWSRWATRYGWDFAVEDVKTPLNDCVDRLRRRNLESDRIIDASVLFSQAKRFPVERWPVITKREFNPVPVGDTAGLPKAIICDIDGTLAGIPKGGRSPYDYTRVSEDFCQEDIATLVRILDPYAHVLVVSGRKNECYTETKQWLTDNNIPFDALLMRDTELDVDVDGDLPDFIVKYRLFDSYIRPFYDVQYVIDDRRQVVEDCWRRIGLRVLDVVGNSF